jgi:hypothetical protein
VLQADDNILDHRKCSVADVKPSGEHCRGRCDLGIDVDQHTGPPIDRCTRLTRYPALSLGRAKKPGIPGR